MQTAAVAASTGRGARMLAWRLHAYGAGAGEGCAELRLEEARAPALRSPSEVLVRVHAASINPLDVAMIGGYGARVLNALRKAEGAGSVEFPLVLGRDFVGEVERLGPGAGARVRRGQRVWGVVPPHRAGSHAQLVAVEESCVGAAPAGLRDAEAGGALYAALSACAALRAAGLGPAELAEPASPARGRRVLLLGLGGVGHVALQLLVHYGAQVTVGCAGSACEEARERGALLALDRHAPDYQRRLVDCGPYDAIIDCAGLGGGEASGRAWQFARYVTLTTPLLRYADAHGLAAGAARAGAELLGHSAAAALASAPRDPALGPCPPHVRWAFFSPRTDDIDSLRRLADRGKLAVRVERVFPWREAPAAYQCAAREQARGPARGKLLLDFTRDR